MADFVRTQAVFDLAQKAIGNGEKVLIYTSWVRVDSQQKLQKLFRLDYASIGEQTLAEFKQYIKRVNEKALEETVRQNKGNIHG